MTQHEWDQQPNESLLWFRRFDTFRLMEPVRKVALVFQQEQREAQTEKNRGRQRTEPPGQWYEIAKQWHWQERAAAWDAYRTSEQEELIAAERAKITRLGFALMHKRVQVLDALTKRLITQAAQEDKLWLPDVKSIGTGKSAQRVDLIQFNEGLIREIRGCLADIAAEMGERVKTTKSEITGANGKPLLPPGHNELLAAMSDEEFEQLKQLQQKAQARLEQHDTSNP